MTRSVRTLAAIAFEELRYMPGRQRAPEPMAMNRRESVAQFHAGGEVSSGMRAVYDLSARALDALVPPGGRLLDLGVGSGRSLGRFLNMRRDVHATGIDISPEMLAQARRFLDSEGLGERVTLQEGDLTALREDVAGDAWDAVASVWTLHHLPNREALAKALRQIARLRGQNRSAIWLLDFQRLRNPDSLKSLQSALEPDIPPVLRSDALASEAAAFTYEELHRELSAAQLGDLDSGVAQPVPWLQAFWDRGSAPQGPVRYSTATASDDSADLRRNFSRLPI